MALCLLQNVAKIRAKADDFLGAKKTILAAQLGAVLATVRTYVTTNSLIVAIESIRGKWAIIEIISFSD